MKEFVKSNRKKFLENLNEGEMAIFFNGTAPNSTADSHYPFRVDKNFFYFTGIKEEEFILTLGKIKGKEVVTLFIKKPNPDLEKWVGRYLTKEMCIEISGIEKVKYLDEFNEWINKAIVIGHFEILYLDMFRNRFEVSSSKAEMFAKTIQDKYPQVKIHNSAKIMNNLRVIKSEFEIKQLQDAIDMTKEGLVSVLKSIKSGDKEYQAVATFNYTIASLGAQREAFETIAASGDNAVILHYITNRDIMNDGELLLLDLGAQVNEYSADISRTYPVNGKFTKRQKQIYNIVLKANEEVIKMIKPGLDFEELNKKTREILGEELIKIDLIKSIDELSKYYYHGVSHFLGLDTHDLGVRETKLKSGMVITVEPGLYIEDEALGIRIEDDVLVTETGFKVLSKDIIKSVDDIEKIMFKE